MKLTKAQKRWLAYLLEQGATHPHNPRHLYTTDVCKASLEMRGLIAYHGCEHGDHTRPGYRWGWYLTPAGIDAAAKI